LGSPKSWHKALVGQKQAKNREWKQHTKPRHTINKNNPGYGKQTTKPIRSKLPERRYKPREVELNNQSPDDDCINVTTNPRRLKGPKRHRESGDAQNDDRTQHTKPRHNVRSGNLGCVVEVTKPPWPMK
jgi:hypothetical protein